MNNQQRREYSSMAQRVMKRYERIYVKRIFGILHGQAVEIAIVVKNRGAQAAINHLYRSFKGEGLAKTIQDAWVHYGLYIARKTEREINASAKKTVLKDLTASLGKNEKWTADIIKFLETELFNTVNGIDQTTVDQLLAGITEGVDNGWSIDKIVNNLLTPDLMLWRARLIASTELAKASNEARKIAAEDSEWHTQKEWISAEDNRVRPAHAAVDGEVVNADSRFNVGGEMMDGPGDPTASPANVCNCRCQLATTAMRGKDGRLVPKKTISVILPGHFTRPNQTIITI